MQKYLIAGVLAMALAAPAFAEGMSGPAQTGGGMSGGMAASDGMHHDSMGKKKPKKPMKHDAMSGGSMSGPAQTGNSGMAGGMSGPAH